MDYIIDKDQLIEIDNLINDINAILDYIIILLEFR
jgi:hypothetical protein